MDKKQKKSTKSKPIGVRFNVKSTERIMKDQGLDTYQGVLDWLIGWYDQTLYPIQLNPVMERNGEATIKLPHPKTQPPNREITVKNAGHSASMSVVSDKDLREDVEPTDRTSPEYKAWRKRNIGF